MHLVVQVKIFVLTMGVLHLCATETSRLERKNSSLSSSATDTVLSLSESTSLATSFNQIMLATTSPNTSKMPSPELSSVSSTKLRGMLMNMNRNLIIFVGFLMLVLPFMILWVITVMKSASRMDMLYTRLGHDKNDLDESQV